MDLGHEDVRELLLAAHGLTVLTEAVESELVTGEYWRSERTHLDLFSVGVNNAMGGPGGELAGLFGPETTRLLTGVFRAWARMGQLEADLLNRVGGPETVALARVINKRIGEEK